MIIQTKERDSMFKIVLVLIITVFSVSANAANWGIFSTYTKDTIYFFDIDTVNKSNDTVTLWTKSVNDENAPNKTGFYSLASREVYSCSKRTYLTLTSTSYSKDHTFIETYNAPSNNSETAIIPDSVADGLLKEVCAKDFAIKNTTIEKTEKYEMNDVYSFAKVYFKYSKAANNDPAPK